jgi:hypothetical protein
MQLTALGRKFYKNKHTEYIIEIPVIINVPDSKGKNRVRRGRTFLLSTWASATSLLQTG